MNAQPLVDRLNGLAERIRPLGDQYMTEVEREDFEGFLSTLSPIYQSAILLSTIDIAVEEFNELALLERLNNGIDSIQDSLRCQSLKGFFDKSFAFISPFSEAEFSVIVDSWQPRIGGLAQEAAEVEAAVKQSFFSTFGLADSIEEVFGEYKKSFCIFDYPIARFTDSDLEGAWVEYQAVKKYAGNEANSSKWQEWEKSFFENRLQRAEWCLEWLKCSLAHDLHQDELIASNSLGERVFGYVYLMRNQDLYLIGTSSDLLRSIDELCPDEVLSVVRCTNSFEVEQHLNAAFALERVPGTGYFRLADAQVYEAQAAINSLVDL